MQGIININLVAVGVSSAVQVAPLAKGSWKHCLWKGGVEWNQLVQHGGTSGGLLCTRYWIYYIHKMRRISWL